MGQGHRAVGDLPAVEAFGAGLPWTVPSTALWYERGSEPSSTWRQVGTEGSPEAKGPGSTRSPTVARNGLGCLPTISTSVPGADGPLDADGGRFAEPDIDAEVVCQGCLDDLLLHLAVERDEKFLANIVLPKVDPWILFGELGKCNVKRTLVGKAAGR